MARIDRLFQYLKEREGSDLHLAAGLTPRIRRHGALEDVEGWPVLTDATLRDLLQEIASPEDWAEYSECGDLDFAYTIPGLARFRANFLCQENGAAAVFRIIPERVQSAEDLGLPDAIAGLADLTAGLVLVTGPTGSGKSTTLAAIIDRINALYSRHIVTIEDPVEFVHQNRRSVFSHREVGREAVSFAAALKAAVRQDADVILVGEMRDLETISLAIVAAEMGALVFGTLHTNSAAKTVDRLVDAFPAEEQPQIRTTLADSLAAVISQQLVPRADGKGRVAAHEILLAAPGLGNTIREGNTPMLISIIQGGKGQGMQTLDDALARLVASGQVTLEDARRKALNRENLDKLVAEARSQAGRGPLR